MVEVSDSRKRWAVIRGCESASFILAVTVSSSKYFLRLPGIPNWAILVTLSKWAIIFPGISNWPALVTYQLGLFTLVLLAIHKSNLPCYVIHESQGPTFLRHPYQILAANADT